MVVDDEEFCLSTFKVLLKKADIDMCQVDFCIDGLEALNQLKKAYLAGESYQVIFTDFNMPKLDGIQSCKKIRAFLENQRGILKIAQPYIIGITAHYSKKYIK